VKEKPDIIDIIEKKRLQWFGHVKRIARGETTKINYGVDTMGKKKKRTSKKNVDGRCTSSHENTTFRNRSVYKQKGMVFGFRKTATAVVGPEIDRRSVHKWQNIYCDHVLLSDFHYTRLPKGRTSMFDPSERWGEGRGATQLHKF
jgi:hypothetical protein